MKSDLCKWDSALGMIVESRKVDIEVDRTCQHSYTRHYQAYSIMYVPGILSIHQPWIYEAWYHPPGWLTSHLRLSNIMQKEGRLVEGRFFCKDLISKNCSDLTITTINLESGVPLLKPTLPLIKWTVGWKTFRPSCWGLTDFFWDFFGRVTVLWKQRKSSFHVGLGGSQVGQLPTPRGDTGHPHRLDSQSVPTLFSETFFRCKLTQLSEIPWFWWGLLWMKWML